MDQGHGMVLNNGFTELNIKTIESKIKGVNFVYGEDDRYVYCTLKMVNGHEVRGYGDNPRDARSKAMDLLWKMELYLLSEKIYNRTVREKETSYNREYPLTPYEAFKQEDKQTT